MTNRVQSVSTLEEVLAGTARFTVVCGDATAVLKSLPDNAAHVTYCDPPYGLSSQDTDDVVACLQAWLKGETYTHHGAGFMGKDWDAFVPGPEVWCEILRVLKPGAYCVAYSSTRTVDLLGMAMRLAGLETRPGWAWVFGCLSDDTELLTSEGWVHHQKATAGIHALCYNPQHDTYQWQPVEQVFRYPHAGIAYRVHSDRTDQIVTREHRCLVERSGAFVFLRAEDAAQECEVRVPVLEDVQGLLDALPLSQPFPSEGQTDVQPGMCPCWRRGVQQTESASGRRTPGNGADHLCGLPQTSVDPSRMGQTETKPHLFVSMQRCPARARTGEALSQRACGLDGCFSSVLPSEDGRGEQPSLEGRGDGLQDPRQLRGGEVCAVPARVPADGTAGRVCDGAPADRGASTGSMSLAGGSGASPEPRPDGQPAGESSPVRVEPGSQAVRASRFTRADLVRVEPVEYTGTVWCVKVPTGAFVARRNGKVFVTGNSGFPKSLDVGKALDKTAGRLGESVLALKHKLIELFDASGKTRSQIDTECGFRACNYLTLPGEGKRPDPWVNVLPNQEKWGVMKRVLVLEVEPEVEASLNRIFAAAEREVLGTVTKARTAGSGFTLPSLGDETAYKTWDITAPATDAAKQWDGWGTDTKPAYEPLVVTRKPLDGTVAANVVKHGTGALNIDGARISPSGYAIGGETDTESSTNPSGRFPASIALVHDEGCERVGTKKIESKNAVFKYTEAGANLKYYGGGTKGPPHGEYGYADEDGTETVDDWKCTGTCAVAELARQSIAGGRHSAGVSRGGGLGNPDRVSMFVPNSASNGMRYGDTGTAARFFYQAKASASDRLAYLTCSEGCTANDTVATAKDATEKKCPVCNQPRTVYQHPTVKPYELATYHAKLLSLPKHTQPLALVPFCGTGIEARALLDVGFRVIAVDIDPRHVAMTRYRLSGEQPVREAPVTPARESAPAPPAGDTPPLTLDDLFGF